MKRKVQAQRKFAQGAYIPPSANSNPPPERRVGVDLQPLEQKNVVYNKMSADMLLDIISFQNLHQRPEPVVVLKRLSKDKEKPLPPPMSVENGNNRDIARRPVAPRRNTMLLRSRNRLAFKTRKIAQKPKKRVRRTIIKKVSPPATKILLKKRKMPPLTDGYDLEDDKPLKFFASSTGGLRNDATNRRRLRIGTEAKALKHTTKVVKELRSLSALKKNPIRIAVKRPARVPPVSKPTLRSSEVKRSPEKNKCNEKRQIVETKEARVSRSITPPLLITPDVDSEKKRSSVTAVCQQSPSTSNTMNGDLPATTNAVDRTYTYKGISVEGWLDSANPPTPVREKRSFKMPLRPNRKRHDARGSKKTIVTEPVKPKRKKKIIETKIASNKEQSHDPPVIITDKTPKKAVKEPLSMVKPCELSTRKSILEKPMNRRHSEPKSDSKPPRDAAIEGWLKNSIENSQEFKSPIHPAKRPLPGPESSRESLDPGFRSRSVDSICSSERFRSVKDIVNAGEHELESRCKQRNCQACCRVNKLRQLKNIVQKSTNKRDDVYEFNDDTSVCSMGIYRGLRVPQRDAPSTSAPNLSALAEAPDDQPVYLDILPNGTHIIQITDLNKKNAIMRASVVPKSEVDIRNEFSLIEHENLLDQLLEIKLFKSQKSGRFVEKNSKECIKVAENSKPSDVIVIPDESGTESDEADQTLGSIRTRRRAEALNVLRDSSPIKEANQPSDRVNVLPKNNGKRNTFRNVPEPTAFNTNNIKLNAPKKAPEPSAFEVNDDKLNSTKQDPVPCTFKINDDELISLKKGPEPGSFKINDDKLNSLKKASEPSVFKTIDDKLTSPKNTIDSNAFKTNNVNTNVPKKVSEPSDLKTDIINTNTPKKAAVPSDFKSNSIKQNAAKNLPEPDFLKSKDTKQNSPQLTPEPCTLKTNDIKQSASKQAPEPSPSKPIEQNDSSDKMSFPRELDTARLVDAPVFYPSEAEFNDPIAFFEKISAEAAKFGLCKVVAPASFRPSCSVSDEIRFNVSNQYVARLYSRWGRAAREMCAIRAYLASQSVTFSRAPLYEGIEVNLPKLYHIVQRNGGLKNVIEKKRWGRVAEEMHYTRAPNAEKRLDQLYVKYLLPYDTLSTQERQEMMNAVERCWDKKNRKMLERALNPLHRQKRLLGESDSSSDDAEEEGDMAWALAEAEDCVVSGRSMTLATFKKVASSAMETLFPRGGGGTSDPPDAAAVEREYWRVVVRGTEHVCVNAASIDTGDDGHGFTKNKADPYGKHPWNLKMLSQNPGNVLRSMGPVLGVTVPTLHLGMVFSTSCWHRDPHALPWVEYMHSGPPTIWYGIPDEQSGNFRKAVETLCPTSCQNKSIWLPSDITMIPPSLLQEHGVSLSRLVQNPGEFVFVFPKAYSCSICTGYTQSESVYFATASWLDDVTQVFQEVRESCEPTMFSLEQVVVGVGWDARASGRVVAAALPALRQVLRRERTLRRALLAAGATPPQASEQSNKVRQPKKRPAGAWNVREQDECEICRSTLYLSKVVGLTGKRSAVCLEHALRLLNTGHKPSDGTLVLHVSQQELNEALNAAERRLQAGGSRAPRRTTAAVSDTKTD